jgi:protein-L-isoaspartate(D-aspartate) O-methyltransferase
MVQRIAKQGVKDQVVLGAMDTVPRHLFMDEGLAPQAVDASLPIGHHQTISQPYIVARMIEVMRNGGQLKRVLEIGTGCGYQAAVLSCVAQEVYSIERIKPLHELAKANLRPLRVPNLRCITEMVCLACRRRPRLTVSYWPPPGWRCRKRCWNSWPSAVAWSRRWARARSIWN